MSKRILFTFGIAALATCFAQAQQPSAGANSMPGMDMSSHDQSAPPAQNTAGSMKDMPGMDASAADHTMEGHHMDMGPHMKMTALAPPEARRLPSVPQHGRRSRPQSVRGNIRTITCTCRRLQDFPSRNSAEDVSLYQLPVRIRSGFQF